MGHHGIANNHAPNPRSRKLSILAPCYLTPAGVGAKPLGRLSIANGWTLIAFTSSSGRRVRFAEGRATMEEVGMRDQIVRLLLEIMKRGTIMIP